MKNLRFILAVILITVLTGSSALADASTESEAEDALTYLGRELEATAKHLIRTGEDTDDVYTEISWKSVADTFPEKFDLPRLCQLLQGRTEVFSQLPAMVDFLAAMPDFDPALYTNKKSKTTTEIAKAALQFIRPILEGIDNWTETALHYVVMEAIPASGMKNSQVLWPFRIAITGRAATPGGAFEMAYLLGKEETLSRLAKATETLETAI